VVNIYFCNFKIIYWVHFELVFLFNVQTKFTYNTLYYSHFNSDMFRHNSAFFRKYIPKLQDICNELDYIYEICNFLYILLLILVSVSIKYG
jgi:hypothetical protein